MIRAIRDRVDDYKLIGSPGFAEASLQFLEMCWNTQQVQPGFFAPAYLIWAWEITYAVEGAEVRLLINKWRTIWFKFGLKQPIRSLYWFVQSLRS